MPNQRIIGIEMQTIKQRHDKDCWLCCLAMATGIKYDTLTKRFGLVYEEILKEQGTHDWMADAVWKVLGYERGKHYQHLSMSPHWGTLGFIRNALWGRRAIITVKSKNHWNGQHAVYWSGEEFHDPSLKSQFKWEEVEPINLILFNEVRTAPCLKQ